jgi:hypothetical protein
MISVGFKRVSKNVPCRIAANPSIVVSRDEGFRETKVLPSACGLVRELKDTATVLGGSHCQINR